LRPCLPKPWVEGRQGKNHPSGELIKFYADELKPSGEIPQDAVDIFNVPCLIQIQTPMDDVQALQLKRVVNIKAVVTSLWKEEAQKQLQLQINQMDGQLQQLEMQGQRMMTELQKQAETQPGNLGVQQQIADVQNRLNQDKSKLLEQKNQNLQQLPQVQTVDLGVEVEQGKVESFFTVSLGDNLVKKLQVEILLKDGIIEEIRGEL
jgi:predicted RNase H-like nuclease (RuvC/YqgF family)